MENSNPNMIPEMKIIDLKDLTLKSLHFVADHIRHIGISSHSSNTGGGPALDRALYETQPELPFNRWDSEGRDVPEGF